MTLSPGNRLGPYEVASKLGEGGMGEVWRARDSHLGRDVALKVLPEGFTQDTERLARFEREAKLLAQLNHPNIAQIYGLEVSGDTRALVMELVEGPTLAERLEQGPLPLNESLSISLQIAQALEEAHEKGIVHRDLKPQNVKASIEGKVKVLDFGLAKAMDPTGSASGAASASQMARSPTLTMGATVQGVILGTAAYMAPEQARGGAVDKRADIWAFGVVLYEMLTGETLFAEQSVVDTLSAVMRKEIEFARLPQSTPRRVRDLLRRCLERNPRNRLHDIADARLELEEAIARPEGAPGTTSSGVMTPVTSLAKRGLSPWALVAAALAAALVGLLVFRPPWSGGSGDGPSAGPRTSRLSWSLPEGISPVPLEESSPLVAVSPDGTTLAAAVINERGEQLLYVRPLDSLESRLLPGTEGASEPIFSPDGRSIAFFAGGELKRTATSGGAVVKIANAPDSRGGAWAPDGTLVYTPVTNAGLMRVAESGGTPQPLTTPDPSRGERTHRWPDVLPEGKAALFTVGTNDSPDFYDEARIEAVVLATGERRPVLEGASLARYLAATGELVFGRGGALYAVAFDAERLAVEGKPRLVLDGVGSDVTSGAVHMALSPDGTLAYLAAEATAAENRLAWLSPDGAVEPLAAPARAYWSSNVSPDGRRIATLLSSRGVGEIWIVDVGQGTLSRLSADDSCFDPIWTPDGRFVVYSRKLENGTEIVRQAADGGVAERLALTSNPSAIARSISRDGTTLFFESHSGKNASDIYSLALDARGEVETVVSSTADQYFPVISPDGRWLAYVSQESGRGEVYVRSYPEPGARRQVSSRGGSEPQWAREGRTLFFRTPSGLARVELGAGPRGEPGAPEPLEKIRMLTRHSNWSYNLAPDGRFLIQLPSSRAQRPEIVVVPDWAAELRRSLTGARR